MVSDLELAAMAAYGAFAQGAADRLGEMPSWEALPPEARADWRAVADAVQMVIAPHIIAVERERIAALADQHRALYWYPGPPDIQGGAPPINHSAPFADLLRNPPEGTP
jgi:hypothetical protein